MSAVAPLLDAPAVTPAFEANPGVQSLMVSCPVGDLLYGGARGPGKTYGLLLDWLEHQDEFGSGAQGLLVRRTYDELEEVCVKAARLFPLIGARWSASKRTWHFPTGSWLRLRYLDNEEDAGRYQGHEYTWIGVDEAGNYARAATIDLLRACLRSGRGVRCVLRLTANPGGVGHNWLKARYIDPAPHFAVHRSEIRLPDASVAVAERVFIPGTLDDNPALQRADPEYWQRVVWAAAGNEGLLKAWRFGDWDIVAGGMFDDVFRRSIHVIEPFEIPASWYLDRAFDWGSSRPYSVGFWAQSDGTGAPGGRHYPRGSLFRVGELYGCLPGRPNEGTKRLAVEVAADVRAWEAAYGRPFAPGPADPSIWATANGLGRSIADDMARAGVRWLRADNAPGSRKIGWEALRRYLKAAWPERDGLPPESPALYVFATCVDWIRTVPVLRRDGKKPDDVDTDAEDHAADETRYRLLAIAPGRVRRARGLESNLRGRA